MRLLDRYIRNTIITTTGIVLLVLVGVYSFLEFISQLSSLGRGDYDAWHAILYTVCQMPLGLYQFFPMAGFLGCLIGLGRLSGTNELTVMRAASVSVLRILFSVCKAALWMLLVVTLLGEWLGPSLQEKGYRLRESAMQASFVAALKQKVWLRHQDTFFYLDQIRSADDIRNIYLFRFNAKRQLQWLAKAKRARLEEGRWWLYDVVGTRFDENGTHAERQAKLALDLKLRPDVLAQSQQFLLQQSVPDLFKTIHYRKQAGLVVSLFDFNLWQRLIQPLTTLVMIALGVPFVFGSLRQVSTASRVLTGVTVGFLFYMLSQFFGPITLLYEFPAWLAALLPTGIFLTFVVFGLRRIRV